MPNPAGVSRVHQGTPDLLAALLVATVRGGGATSRPRSRSCGGLLVPPPPELALRLAALLREDGLRLVQVTGLAAALGAAHLAPPSLVLLDLEVPRGELLAACRKLRSSSDPRLREIPVLLVAGSAPSEREVREAFEAGATDYLTRPVKPTLLRARIRGWLLRSQPS